MSTGFHIDPNPGPGSVREGYPGPHFHSKISHSVEKKRNRRVAANAAHFRYGKGKVEALRSEGPENRPDRQSRPTEMYLQ